MRIDLPFCNLKTCRYCSDGNCRDKNRYDGCDYARLKDTEENSQMDKIMQIKQEMASLGWDIEEKISDEGWGGNIGYTIWFKRSDWHGKYTYSLTGQQVVFIGISEDINNYEAILKTVKNTAEKAKKAWTDFPDAVPCQNARGEVVKDYMVYSFEEGKDIKKVQGERRRKFVEAYEEGE